MVIEVAHANCIDVVCVVCRSVVTHELYGSTLDAPRLVQPAADEDFEIEVKFDSLPTLQYQGQGIIIEQGPTDLLRFDFYSTGSVIKMFAAYMVAGTPTNLTNVTK